MAKGPTKRAAGAKKLQTPVGAEAKTEPAAATSGEAEAKVAVAKAAAAVDPVGAGAASAADPEQSRDAADVPATDRKAGTDEGTQPGATHQPSVAEPQPETTRVLVASVSPKGRRRAGHGFGPDPIELMVDAETLATLESDTQLVVKRG